MSTVAEHSGADAGSRPTPGAAPSGAASSNAAPTGAARSGIHPGTPEPARGIRTRRTILFTALGAALVAAMLWSAGSGQLQIAPGEVWASLMRAIGLETAPEAVPNTDSALWNIRFPRIVMALLIGAALAVAGTVMQAVFANPLAEPGVVGVSSGAALGAAAAIVFGWTAAGDWATAGSAFVAGLATTLLVYFASRAGGRTEIVTLVLTGIAINAFTSGALAFMTFIGDNASREEIVFWQLGSLNGARWQEAAVMLPLIVVALVAALVLGRRLDLFSLGERGARHLGVNVERVRIIAIVIVAVLVCSAVAFAGIIAFVGLIVPHLMRMIIGPSHRALIVASALGGALLLVVADLVARTAMPMADLPIGMLTSIVGGPFFFWLLRRTRKRSGGWG
ncbi:FecCD family ABC transporter permease [Agromyces archimandritae]|uniref:Iron ABC transporter permease n=1 Tax=Agromyces archimandritae TaxID=2781962 RepID=A0A975FPT5_9MICO|nr:iron ABC transporter permease [Agromyces archimandritae]QTX05802.1 iron ABC transporter permease [Agromyces archimandritae]